MENIEFKIMPKLALNMIVKNESKIITRLFDSLIGIIDCYCICDTGSTDNTIQRICEYFLSHGIPGRVITEPFKNFEHNRTFALHACKDAANTGGTYADYILLMDADMVLVPRKRPFFIQERPDCEKQPKYFVLGRYPRSNQHP